MACKDHVSAPVFFLSSCSNLAIGVIIQCDGFRVPANIRPLSGKVVSVYKVAGSYPIS